MPSVSVATSIEWLMFPSTNPRGVAMCDALATVAGAQDVGVARTQDYRGISDILMLWGPGAPNRFPAMAAQIAQGKHVVAFDLAYWSRDRKVRCSIDAAHPQQWVLKKPLHHHRFDRDPVRLSQRWNPDGHVLVAGIGEKATVQYGRQVRDWEDAIIAQAKADGRQVRYRRKRGFGTLPAGVTPMEAGTIEHALEGASLLVTWHSNVAVDAIQAGIPVVCRDGAAAAICPSVYLRDQRPLSEKDQFRFLKQLAWFQWAPAEAGRMLEWLVWMVRAE